MVLNSPFHIKIDLMHLFKSYDVQLKRIDLVGLSMELQEYYGQEMMAITNKHLGAVRKNLMAVL